MWHEPHAVSPPCLEPWQPEHQRGVPANLPFGWHLVHATFAWAPVRGQMELWLNVAGMNADDAGG